MIQGNISLENFIDNNVETAVGKLYNIKAAIISLYDMADEQVDAQSLIIDEIEQLKDQLNAVNDQLNYDPNDSGVKEQWRLLSEQLRVANQNYSSFYFNLESERKMAAQNILSENNLIETMGVSDFNEKFLNTLYLETIILQIRQVNQNELDMLRTIALQCVQDGGDAVFWARAWYNHLKREILRPEDCAVNEQNQIQESQFKFALKENADLIIEPNPNSGTMNVRFNKVENPNIKLEVLNTLGKIVKTYPLEIGQLSKTLNLNQSSGIFFIILKNDREILTSQKFIIK